LLLVVFGSKRPVMAAWTSFLACLKLEGWQQAAAGLTAKG